jgi:hypothetical protein
MDIITKASSTILPSRSRYQLRHFVLHAHDTRPMQWRQIVLEAQKLAYDIAMAELDIKKKQIEIKRLAASGDEVDAIEAEERRLGIALTERVLAGARLELGWLEELAAEVGQFTAEQIEADQPEYWRLRLSRQASMDRMSIQQGIGACNLNSMLQAGMLQLEGQQQCDILPGA